MQRKLLWWETTIHCALRLSSSPTHPSHLLLLLLFSRQKKAPQKKSAAMKERKKETFLLSPRFGRTAKWISNNALLVAGDTTVLPPYSHHLKRNKKPRQLPIEFFFPPFIAIDSLKILEISHAKNRHLGSDCRCAPATFWKMLWKKLRQQTEVHQVDKKSITGPLRHWSATNIKGKTNKLLTAALTYFPTADADEKNTPKNTQAKTQTDLFPSDPLPKNTDLASPREVEEENVLHAGRRHSLLSSPSTSRRCRLARPLSRPLRWSSLGGPTFPFDAAAAAAAAAASAAAVGWTEHRTKLKFHPHPQAISVFFIYFTYVS